MRSEYRTDANKADTDNNNNNYMGYPNLFISLAYLLTLEYVSGLWGFAAVLTCEVHTYN